MNQMINDNILPISLYDLDLVKITSRLVPWLFSSTYHSWCRNRKY